MHLPQVFTGLRGFAGGRMDVSVRDTVSTGNLQSFASFHLQGFAGRSERLDVSSGDCSSRSFGGCLRSGSLFNDSVFHDGGWQPAAWFTNIEIFPQRNPAFLSLRLHPQSNGLLSLLLSCGMTFVVLFLVT